MSDKKVIIFDLGKVIFDYDIEKMAKKFLAFSCEKKPDFTSIYPATFMYEKGQISSLEYYDKVTKLLSLDNISYEDFSKIWNEIFTPNDEVIEIVKKVSKKNTVALLSNTNELHFDYLYGLNRNFFDNCFENLHVSYLMNARKPEKEIFQQVIAFYKILPEKLFFTDDVPENVEAARAQGIKAFLFKGAEKLKKDLKSFGVEQC